MILQISKFKYKIVSILYSITMLMIFWILTALCMVTWHKSGSRYSDVTQQTQYDCNCFNPLNGELNPICHFLALLGARPILHVSRIRFNRDWTLIVVINAIVTLKVLQCPFSSRRSDYINKINLQCRENAWIKSL